MSAARNLKWDVARPRQSELDSMPHVSLELSAPAVFRLIFGHGVLVALNRGVTFRGVARSKKRVGVRSHDAKLTAVAFVSCGPRESAAAQENVGLRVAAIAARDTIEARTWQARESVIFRNRAA
jgi:hypothetical protein